MDQRHRAPGKSALKTPDMTQKAYTSLKLVEKSQEQVFYVACRPLRLPQHPMFSFALSSLLISGFTSTSQHFMEYHGHEKWANPSYIRSTLLELGLTKEPKDPIKLSEFSR